MATFRRFEDILAWQKAREITKLVYQITRDGDFARDFGLRDQLRRASVSVMANIAEGFGRRSDKEFANFLTCLMARQQSVNHIYMWRSTSTTFLSRISSCCIYLLKNVPK